MRDNFNFCLALMYSYPREIMVKTFKKICIERYHSISFPTLFTKNFFQFDYFWSSLITSWLRHFWWAFFRRKRKKWKSKAFSLNCFIIPIEKLMVDDDSDFSNFSLFRLWLKLDFFYWLIDFQMINQKIGFFLLLSVNNPSAQQLVYTRKTLKENYELNGRIKKQTQIKKGEQFFPNWRKIEAFLRLHKKVIGRKPIRFF